MFLEYIQKVVDKNTLGKNKNSVYTLNTIHVA